MPTPDAAAHKMYTHHAVQVGYDPWKAENRVDGRPAGAVKVKPEAMLSGEVEAIGKRIR
jgi:hypothetical protein